jgi:hypothetical protein
MDWKFIEIGFEDVNKYGKHGINPGWYRTVTENIRYPATIENFRAVVWIDLDSDKKYGFIFIGGLIDNKFKDRNDMIPKYRDLKSKYIVEMRKRKLNKINE